MVKSVAHDVAKGIGITCHAWNKDRTMVAVCPNTPGVNIYKVTDIGNNKSQWELIHELNEHDQVVTGIDWAPDQNRIVTSSQDRNAYVWNYEEGKWKPTLVILRVNRAATAVKWNADEDKFAVGSGARCVPVCYYDPEQNWWVSKIIKKHKSTVLALAWHPKGCILATASSDFKCRVFSAYVKEVDKKKDAAKENLFAPDAKLGFGDVLAEFPCNGWVHDVKWSPSGSHLAFIGHDSSVSICPATPSPAVQTIKAPTLPFRSLQFLSDGALVAVGHELNPIVYQLCGSEWQVKGKLDKPEERKQAAQSQAKAAFAMFQNQAKKATAGGDGNDTVLPTKHQNSVSCIVPLTNPGEDVTRFTTSGLDGLVVYWELPSLDQAMQSLTL